MSNDNHPEFADLVYPPKCIPGPGRCYPAGSYPELVKTQFAAILSPKTWAVTCDNFKPANCARHPGPRAPLCPKTGGGVSFEE